LPPSLVSASVLILPPESSSASLAAMMIDPAAPATSCI